jgi:hypothetical protein
MLGKAVGAMLATQVGSGLGAMAGEVVSASDIGVPLGPAGTAALVPANVAVFAEGLDVPDSDVLLYLALREAAHQRLFAGVPWLRDHVIGAVTEYAQGIEINTDRIQQTMEERLRGIDPTNPAQMQELMEGGLFDIPRSPQQEAALKRLEIALALVEGWVDEVVGQATEERMPTAAKLQEAVRRRRAAGGPAEETFASLVGLELRPRRLRDGLPRGVDRQVPVQGPVVGLHHGLELAEQLSEVGRTAGEELLERRAPERVLVVGRWLLGHGVNGTRSAVRVALWRPPNPRPLPAPYASSTSARRRWTSPRWWRHWTTRLRAG